MNFHISIALASIFPSPMPTRKKTQEPRDKFAPLKYNISQATSRPNPNVHTEKPTPAQNRRNSKIKDQNTVDEHREMRVPWTSRTAPVSDIRYPIHFFLSKWHQMGFKPSTRIRWRYRSWRVRASLLFVFVFLSPDGETSRLPQEQYLVHPKFNPSPESI